LSEFVEVDEAVTLYRAIGLDEADDILLSGGFRLGPGSAFVEGKWFAMSHSHAVRWGKLMPPVSRVRTFLVAAVILPAYLVGELARLPQLDGIGPAVFVRHDQLHRVNAVGAISISMVD